MLEFKGVYAGYDKENIIKNTTFTVKNGEITVLVGKNGCGKSTLIKCLNRQINIREGKIMIDSKDITLYSPKDRAKKIAIMPQIRSIPSISVEGLAAHGRYPHLSYGRRLGEKDREIVDKALKLTNTEGLRHRNVSELSGGQRQRVYLAMTLAQSSEYIVLDEPAAYLDITYQLELMDMLKLLKSMGRTVLAVYHDLSQALKIADSIGVMENGEVIFQGGVTECLEEKILEKVFRVKAHSISLDSGSFVVFEK
ncbi:MAG: ABC transporter ATP-binding protein [Lachnospiraceae bacterium]